MAVVIKGVDGSQRIVHVSDHELISDDEDFASGDDKDPIAIDEDDNSLICCVYGNCSCNSLDHALANLTSNVLINITTDVTLSSLVTVSDLENVSIIGHNNPTVNCRKFNGIQFNFSRHLIIQGITWIGCGTDNINHTKPGLSLSYSSNGTIQNCTFQQSVGQAILLLQMSGDVNINNCKFVNNRHYRGHGAAIHYSSSTNNTINYSQFVLTINKCNFSYNKMKSLVCLENKCDKINLSNSIFYYNRGISVYAINHNEIYLNGKFLFESNTADNGAGIYISDHSTVTFVNNSEVTFIQNSAKFKGGAIFLRNHSSILFDQNSVVGFYNNGATIGTVYSDAWSNVTFKGNCYVTFSGNSATLSGAAIYSDKSLVTFMGNSNVTFSSYHASNDNFHYNGGTIYSIKFSNISFEGSSTTLFINNDADGGVIFSIDQSSISFEGNSNTTFSNNYVGGAIYHKHYGSISFKGNASTMFSNNTAKYYGKAIQLFARVNMFFGGNSNTTFIDNNYGAIYCFICNISHEGNSTAMFNNNTGGAVHCYAGSITFEGMSTTVYNNNTADKGGAVYFVGGSSSEISFNRNSTVVFRDNMANRDGGAVYSDGDISFNRNSTVVFRDNMANQHGGAVFSDGDDISFNGNSNTAFRDNTANDNGGAVYSDGGDVSFNGNSNTAFRDNTANDNGGAVYSDGGDVSFNGNSNTEFRENTVNNNNGGAIELKRVNMLFGGNSVTTFIDNEATLSGGVMYCDSNCNIAFSGFTNVSFNDNNANNGGAGYFNGFCSVTFKQNANVTFENNNALYGGAICLNSNTSITFNDNSIALFKNNMATNDGGAIHIVGNSSIMVNDNTTITFTINNALYGGAMFFDATHTTLAFNKNKRNINFNHNTARIAGSYMYFDSTRSSGTCLNDRIIGINDETKHFIATPPSKLEFYAPATCIYDNKTGECNTYHLRDIMLGEEMNIPVCVFNYCNQPSYSTPFLLHGVSNQNYSISGSKRILISCNDTFQGISLTGNNNLTKPSNYTINIVLHDDRNSDWKQISVNLTIQLTSCYPGFWQNSKSVKCECYSSEDIVLCSGSNSTIKRGYWFGEVAEQPTVTICPVNYCDFTCCEASNGYYHLSPIRDNQCRSHRSGTACGSCTDGYTLSFDSTECVNVDSCTAGQTVLVILLTVIYWIVMVTLVFAMMYYKVPIGYLYSITYYYSIVDILLSQNLQDFRGFYLTVSIMSSFSKITPQFLGELCLTTGMSGIDQQFIHYIHPTAVILILVLISLSARSSRRISAFISRGVIHVICLLLLLSYTSIASTSLLLMRSLMFHGIDKIYTYLSPDIEYFHGRHLAYGIVALLCTITIVVGFPLLLILEPFLNRKINFAKIKPLLDQFQGCYKDKYRCFAGYYMICRLVIITIVIANSSNEFVANYFLIAACVVITLIHITAKPYNNKIINKFDDMILLLIILITALPLFDDFDSLLVISIVFVLVLLPLLTFTAITLFLHKDDLKKIAKYFTFKDKASNGNGDNISVHNQEIPMKKFDIIVDDSARKNVAITVCDT